MLGAEKEVRDHIHDFSELLLALTKIDHSRVYITTGGGIHDSRLNPLNSSVGLAAEKLAGAGAADEFAGVDDGAAAGENGFGRALDADALEHGIVHAHVMGFRADDFLVVGIEDHQVGVRTDGDGALARVKAEEFCGRGGNELDKAIRRKMFAVDAARIDKA